MKIWRVILAVVVIFSAGVVTGALVMRSQMKKTASNPPMPMPGGPPGSGMWSLSRQQFVQKMHVKLELTHEQCGKVDKIMADSHERMAKLWEPIAPQAKEETKHVRVQIQELLTPEQKVKFEETFKPKKPGQPQPPHDKEKSTLLNSTNLDVEKKEVKVKECSASSECALTFDW